jgi:hypothetical protein
MVPEGIDPLWTVHVAHVCRVFSSSDISRRKYSQKGRGDGLNRGRNDRTSVEVGGLKRDSSFSKWDDECPFTVTW